MAEKSKGTPNALGVGRPLLIDPFGNVAITPTRTKHGSWYYRGSGWVSRLFDSEREAQFWFSTRGGVAPAFAPKGKAFVVPKVAEPTMKSAPAKKPLTIDPFSGKEISPTEVKGTQYEVPYWKYIGEGWQSKAFKTLEAALYWFSYRFGIRPSFTPGTVVITRHEGELPRAILDAEVMEGLDLPGTSCDA